jgi:predicted O-methyltransferase YrrM
MLPEDVFARLGSLAYMRLEQARIFYDLITANRLSNCLELGFFHGVSTAYIAGAIQDLGEGQLTTIDLISAADRTPNIEWVLSVTGLRSLVHIYFEPRSFNWRLMKLLEEGRFESYDFCYFDGGHTWYDTGFAFCLIERLLKPHGWVVFDDLHFTFRDSSSRDRSWVRRMPEEEQVVPQVERVFELLVESNPNFGSFRKIGRFGFARKRDAMWSQELRDRNQVDLLVASALDRARTDREFRVALLVSSAKTLSSMSARPERDFAHLRFMEGDSRSPVAPEISEYGSTVIYIERPNDIENAS